MRRFLIDEYALVLSALITVEKLTEIKLVEMCAFPDFIFVKISTGISPFFFEFCLSGLCLILIFTIRSSQSIRSRETFVKAILRFDYYEGLIRCFLNFSTILGVQ